MMPPSDAGPATSAPADAGRPATSVAPLVRRRQVGRFTVHAIQAGGLKLDGGAMFGIVAKPLWERRIPADERNRIQLGMRCLLVEHDVGLVLIDSGVGSKEDAKFREIYRIENAAERGRTALEEGVLAAGFQPEDVALVINTHLHFDHAGGNTYRDASGAIRASFPNARYVVQRGEYHYATHTNERTAGSYFAPNYVPLHEAGRFDFVEGERELLAGVRLLPTPGHTPHHQSVLLDGGGERALFVADLVPTAAHLPLPWIMGYDVEPLVTLETKRRILRRAVEERWLVVFEHDAVVPWGRVGQDGKGYGLAAE
jgi:glyoxylase-like metal-dependent hydrolase (beta-lactamase superfamily II)